MIKFANTIIAAGVVAAAIAIAPANAAGSKGVDSNTIKVSSKVLANPDSKICVTQPVVPGMPAGSSAQKECHTKAEWEAQGVTIVAK